MSWWSPPVLFVSPNLNTQNLLPPPLCFLKMKARVATLRLLQPIWNLRRSTRYSFFFFFLVKKKLYWQERTNSKREMYFTSIIRISIENPFQQCVIKTNILLLLFYSLVYKYLWNLLAFPPDLFSSSNSYEAISSDRLICCLAPLAWNQIVPGFHNPAFAPSTAAPSSPSCTDVTYFLPRTSHLRYCNEVDLFATV